MKKLLNAYGFTSDMQYFEMIVESFLNGQFAQGYRLFDDLPKKNKAQMLKTMTIGGWNSGLGDHKIANLFDRL